MDTSSKKRAFFFKCTSPRQIQMEITALGKIQSIRRPLHAISIFGKIRKNMPAIEIWLFVSFNVSQSATAIKSYKGK